MKSFNALEYLRDYRRKSADEAFTHAMARLFGADTARVLKAILLAKYPANGGGEAAALRQGLTDLLHWQARAVEELARREGSLGPAVALSDGMASLGPHGHLLHFRGPEDELEGALRCVATAMRRSPGTTAFAVYPGDGMGALKGRLRADGFGRDLEGGRIGFIPLEGFMRAGQEEGNMATPIAILKEAFTGALDRGYDEVWMSGHLAGRLFDAGLHRLNSEWEAFLHRAIQDHPLTIHCSYAGATAVDAGSMEYILRSHNWLAYDGGACTVRYP